MINREFVLGAQANNIANMGWIKVVSVSDAKAVYRYTKSNPNC